MDLVHRIGLDVSLAGDDFACLCSSWFLLGDGFFIDVVIRQLGPE